MRVGSNTLTRSNIRLFSSHVLPSVRNENVRNVISLWPSSHGPTKQLELAAVPCQVHGFLILPGIPIPQSVCKSKSTHIFTPRKTKNCKYSQSFYATPCVVAWPRLLLSPFGALLFSVPGREKCLDSWFVSSAAIVRSAKALCVWKLKYHNSVCLCLFFCGLP